LRPPAGTVLQRRRRRSAWDGVVRPAGRTERSGHDASHDLRQEPW